MRLKFFTFLVNFLLTIHVGFSQEIHLKDAYTHEIASFKKVSIWLDGKQINDKHIDGVIFIKNNGKYYQRITSGNFDLRWFNVNKYKDDLSALLSKTTLLAYKTGNKLFIPKELGELYLNRETNIYSSLISDGIILKMPCLHKRFLNLQNSGIIIKGLNILIDNSIRMVNAPIAIEINGNSNVKIINNKIVNGRINSSFVQKRPKEIFIEDNLINCDFSNFSNNTIQNDIIYIYNVTGLYVKRNRITSKNANRIMKISSSDASGLSTAKNIYIEGNNIQSSTNSQKQVIDLFQHTQNVLIRDNVFSSTGHLSVIENKTTGRRNYVTNLRVVSNSFITDGTTVRVFGSFGEKNNNQSGFQDLYFERNKIISTKESGVVLNAAHFNKVVIIGNNFVNKNLDSFIRIAGIDQLSIKSNEFSATKLIFTDERKVGDAQFYDDFNSISIEDNVFYSKKDIVHFINSKKVNNLYFKNNRFPNGTRKDKIIFNNSVVKKIYRDDY